MKIEIWSDYVCPFCYLGERKLKKAIEKTGKNKEVDIIFHSFELDPNAKKQYSESINELLAKKYGMSIEQAKESNNNIIRAARQEGLDYRFDNLKPTNTFDAHRLSHYAKTEGKLNEYTEAVMRSYFTDSLNISDFGVLSQIAEEVGLNKEKALRILGSTEFSSEVREDEENAQELGISGVPYFLLNGKEIVSGAQPVEIFVKALEKAKKEV
jgi:predicted DsbA family dithiol-disulfide isomerase